MNEGIIKTKIIEDYVLRKFDGEKTEDSIPVEIRLIHVEDGETVMFTITNPNDIASYLENEKLGVDQRIKSEVVENGSN
jgi:hypothetical protein